MEVCENWISLCCSTVVSTLEDSFCVSFDRKSECETRSDVQRLDELLIDSISGEDLEDSGRPSHETPDEGETTEYLVPCTRPSNKVKSTAFLSFSLYFHGLALTFPLLFLFLSSTRTPPPQHTTTNHSDHFQAHQQPPPAPARQQLFGRRGRGFHAESDVKQRRIQHPA